MAAAANHKRDRVARASGAVPGTVRSIWAQDTLCPRTPEDSMKDWIWGGRESRREKGTFQKVQTLSHFCSLARTSGSRNLLPKKGPPCPRHLACFFTSISSQYILRVQQRGTYPWSPSAQEKKTIGPDIWETGV